MSRSLTGPLIVLLLVSLAIGSMPVAVGLPSSYYTSWTDRGIVYTAPLSGDAYFPSVTYDANGFGAGSPLYKMWYSNGLGDVFVVSSSDGVSWGTAASVTGLGGDAHHVQVLYDSNCFGSCGSIKYEIWYSDIDANLFSINAISYAESSDGVSWTNDQAVTQDASNKLVTGTGPDWNSASYGPIHLTYQAGAPNTGTNPWAYRYVMYYDGTNGANEFTGLAYSVDGLFWTAFSDNPVLRGSSTAAWDCSDDVYGTVYRDVNGYHFWYGGGGANDGSGGCLDQDVSQGIGYASSSDGESWTKDSGNPIFHISDGVSYRNERVYTPSVVNDGCGVLRMYYSAKGSGGPKKIGLAVNQIAVSTATGMGCASFMSNAGLLEGLMAVAESSLPSAGKPSGLSFPDGFFAFQVNGLSAGGSATVTITLPAALSGSVQVWKVNGGAWTRLPASKVSVSGKVVTLTLTDGASPDDADGSANGVIVCPVGLGVPVTPSSPPPAVGGEVLPINVAGLIAPWLVVLGLVGCVGTVVVVAKKR